MAVELAHSVENADAAGTPMVLIHGVGDSRTIWGDILGPLPRRPIVRYDLRGHADSPKPPGPYSIDDLVDDHNALLDKLGIDQADTIGFSLGGLTAQAIAIRRPDRVRRLIAIGSVAGRTEEERQRALDRWRRVRELGPYGVAKESVERWHTKKYLAEHPEATAQTLQRMASLDPAAYAACYGVLATTDLADELDQIKAPTLAMTGEYDVGSPPRMSKMIAERVADGRVVIIPDARHSVLREQAEFIAKEIADHVR